MTGHPLGALWIRCWSGRSRGWHPLRLEPIPPERMPALATEWLAAGIGGDAVLKAASSDFMDSRDKRDLFIAALKEVDAWLPSANDGAPTALSSRWFLQTSAGARRNSTPWCARVRERIWTGKPDGSASAHSTTDEQAMPGCGGSGDEQAKAKLSCVEIDEVAIAFGPPT
jgi:hypothetical protein